MQLAKKVSGTFHMDRLQTKASNNRHNFKAIMKELNKEIHFLFKMKLIGAYLSSASVIASESTQTG